MTCYPQVLLTAEIQQTTSHWKRESDICTSVIVDFMSKMRRFPLAQFHTIEEFIDAVFKSAATFYQATAFIHMFFTLTLSFHSKNMNVSGGTMGM